MVNPLNIIPTGYKKVTRNNGTEEWLLNGKLHRENDQPAVINPNSYKEWWVNGELHRDDDRPAGIHPDGTQCWYQHGLLHRDGDEPAIIHSDGYKEWWVNGERHRLKGAAVIGAEVEKLNRWFLYDKETTEHQHKAFIKQIASEGQGLEYFQSLPYEYQKRAFTTLFNED